MFTSWKTYLAGNFQDEIPGTVLTNPQVWSSIYCIEFTHQTIIFSNIIEVIWSFKTNIPINPIITSRRISSTNFRVKNLLGTIRKYITVPVLYIKSLRVN